MAIRIITDSASDITQEEARTWGIQVLPLRTIFGEEEFLDGVTIDHQTFFQRLIESDVLPTTSQLSPFQYEGPFQEAVKAGDEVVCITLSSKLSGCYQSAVIAAEGLPVVLVDSLSVTVGQRILVELALQLRDPGPIRPGNRRCPGTGKAPYPPHRPVGHPGIPEKRRTHFSRRGSGRFSVVYQAGHRRGKRRGHNPGQSPRFKKWQ